MKPKKWKAYPRYIFRKEIVCSMINRLKPNIRFLDIGCASGDFGISLAKKGHSGVLIDFSEDASLMVNLDLKKHKDLNLVFLKVDFNEFEIDEKFDLITMFETLEHIEDENKVLQKVYNLLNDQSTFIFSVPARKKLWGDSDEFVGHLRRYEKKEIADLLSTNKFELVKIISYGYPFLNIIRIIRDKVAKVKMEQLKNTVNKKELTKQSGLNSTSIKFPFMNLFFNKYTLYFPIKISSLFSSMDLAEGYICVAKKTV